MVLPSSVYGAPVAPDRKINPNAFWLPWALWQVRQKGDASFQFPAACKLLVTFSLFVLAR